MTKAEQYIQDCTRHCSNYTGVINKKTCEGYYVPWLTPDQARKAVETEKEEMIEKACEYLDGLIELLNDHGHELKKERIIGGLKQAMEE